MIHIIIFVTGCLLIKLDKTTKQRNIYYNNYKQCLNALAEIDPKLKEYLEVNKEI